MSDTQIIALLEQENRRLKEFAADATKVCDSVFRYEAICKKKDAEISDLRKQLAAANARIDQLREQCVQKDFEIHHLQVCLTRTP